MKNCSPWERLALEKFLEDWLPWKGPHTGPEEECEESLKIFSVPCGAEDGEWLSGTQHPARVNPPQVHGWDMILNPSYQDSWVLNKTPSSRLNCGSREVQLVPAKMLSSSSLALQGVCTVYVFTQHFLPQFPFPLSAGVWRQLIPPWKRHTLHSLSSHSSCYCLAMTQVARKRKRTGCKKCGSERALGQKVVCHIAKAQRRRKKWEKHQRWEKTTKWTRFVKCSA